MRDSNNDLANADVELSHSNRKPSIRVLKGGAYTEDESFKSLVKVKNTVSMSLAFIELVLYFGFIFLVAYNKEILGIKVLGDISLGIPLAVGTIIISWLLTGLYILWANSSYDRMVESFKGHHSLHLK